MPPSGAALGLPRKNGCYASKHRQNNTKRARATGDGQRAKVHKDAEFTCMTTGIGST